ncbi:MAG: hypothetical protein C1943_10280 [Halochromatium sp.]|nr:hypothetical protein [Halochromatium sp.]
MTLVAYCGGDKLDENKKWIGKCLNYPLVFGREKTCDVCGKLICSKCNFCTKDCQGVNIRMREVFQSMNDIQTPPSYLDDTLDPGYWVFLEEEY